MIIASVIVGYLAVGLVLSRLGWKSGRAHEVAASIEDEPFSPEVLTFAMVFLWPIAAVAKAIGAFVRAFYGEAGK
ncbi:hypothetical protein M609_gp053 [Mycobacterium phage Job42]|uniref:Uncharacterized protein n=2 Tax=Cheoctovirus TaxID=1623281 RepID=Q19YK6_9CAUD|nr:hypothetical protein BOOMER_55 [Mycobacterium phage Boomer]YP_008126643.1 hypothetical protein M609_gp053 [Mycobacterium phage Job42]YP_655808.1 gp47 [Mycobacterium phage PMC]UVK61648.1 membrane protein [Mycobacterium phage Rockne]ABE67548.1 hypothetical protein PBI_PMC_47 [Mycobacterium phage PMC]ACF34117.1 hypothetical protein BOOMER_55 [Mycobacterium phage Boomer]AGM61469.1 hypothetical protein PBI_JOB42_53 [Mycobacterium phage Job42]